MKKWLIGSILVCIAAFIWLPLWMLLSGTIMGSAELYENLVPVLEGGEGTAVWPVIAQYPTLQAYVELLLDTPQFFTVFWNSCRQVLPIILGHVLLGAPAAWAFAKFHFRGKKILYTLYIVLMLMPFQVTMVSSYLVLNKLRLIDTVWAVILQALWPLSLYMANITVDNAGVSLIASLITLMPPLLIFLFGQRYLEQGIISSGMKD